METVGFLADTLGARPAGSESGRAAADYLAGRLESLGLDVERRRFVFRGWRTAGEGTLRVAEDVPETRGLALPYTYATEEEGRRGILREQGLWPIMPGRLECRRFTIEDPTGGVVAAVLAVASGEARPLPNPRPLEPTPTLVVSAEDGRRLSARLTENGGGGLSAVLTTPPVWEGPLESENLIAYAGSGPQLLILSAHYDSVESSPAANDNASGVALLVRLANRYGRRQPPGFRLRFLLCGAEEPFLVGSRFDAATLVADELLRSVSGCLNFDMVAVGERFAVRRPPGSSWERACSTAAPASPLGLPVVQTPAFPSSDHWSFHELGIAAAQFTREPDPAWHVAADTSTRFGGHDLDDAEHVAAGLIESFCALHAPARTSIRRHGKERVR